MSGSGAAPSTSPRLPSPPPFTEVQIGPKSPTVTVTDAEDLLGVPQGQDDGSARRIQPGTKSLFMASGPPLVPLSQLDSPFQLQEHLKATYHHYTRPDESDTFTPVTRHIAAQIAQPPEGIERSLWLYELCRFLTMKANNLIIAFFAENPPCSAQTCPEMRASEWQYLCAVHDPPKSCCAIDYCCHTLDWATNLLTSPKHFPSRLTLGSEAAGGPQASMRHLTNIFRRVYRIFAHAWFQHREVFWQVEGSDGLYVFFKTVCDIYNLIPEDNYTIPAEAEGMEAPDESDRQAKEQPPNKRMTILRKSDRDTPELLTTHEGAENSPSIAPSTTRRHRHSPSTGIGVSTIVEATEDDEQNRRLRHNKQQSVVVFSDNKPEDQQPEPEGDKDSSQANVEGNLESGKGNEMDKISPVAKFLSDSETIMSPIAAPVKESERKPEAEAESENKSDHDPHTEQESKPEVELDSEQKIEETAEETAQSQELPAQAPETSSAEQEEAGEERADPSLPQNRQDDSSEPVTASTQQTKESPGSPKSPETPETQVKTKPEAEAKEAQPDTTTPGDVKTGDEPSSST